MRCAGHADGTGTVCCTVCNTPGCAGCFEEVEGVFYCTDCLLRRLQTVETEVVDTELATELHDVQAEAKRRIRRNWILTAVFSLIGIPAMMKLFTSGSDVPTVAKVLGIPGSCVLAPYLIWASLWGIPAAWRWWKGLFRDTSAFIFTSGFGWVLLAVGFLVIPLEFGYAYGVFGGAVYEYRNTKRIAAGAVLPDPTQHN